MSLFAARDYLARRRSPCSWKLKDSNPDRSAPSVSVCNLRSQKKQKQKLTPQCARHETAPRREATTRRAGAEAAKTRLELERREPDERAAQGATERRTADI